MQRQRGFTLLEMLVVLMIAGLTLSLVTLRLRGDARDGLRADAERVVALLRLARDESRLRARPLIWEAGVDGWRFFETAPDEPGGLRLLREAPLAPARWRTPLDAVTLRGAGAGVAPGVAGDTTPVAVRLRIGGEPIGPALTLVLSRGDTRLRIDSDGAGHYALSDG